ncbi:hypothetical protein G6F42_011640 [Rhizopus arrhizus]|nr:hypothetical protein G6F42_011640 [Rhizopus arrhizus]
MISSIDRHDTIVFWVPEVAGCRRLRVAFYILHPHMSYVHCNFFTEALALSEQVLSDVPLWLICRTLDQKKVGEAIIRRTLYNESGLFNRVAKKKLYLCI